MQTGLGRESRQCGLNSEPFDFSIVELSGFILSKQYLPEIRSNLKGTEERHYLSGNRNLN